MAEFFPGGLLLLVAQPTYPLFESRDAGVMFGQALPDRPSDLFQFRADAGLYSAKSAGRNRLFWHTGESTELVAAEPLEAEPV